MEGKSERIITKELGVSPKDDVIQAFITYLTSDPPPRSEMLRNSGILVETPNAQIGREVFISEASSDIKSGVSKPTKPVWSEKRHSSLTHANILIPFADDVNGKISRDLYPSPLVNQTIQKLNEFADGDGILDFGNQLRIAKEVCDGNLFSSSLVLALALRVIARDRDQKMGVTITPEDSIKILKKLPYFESSGITNPDLVKNVATVGGDWYHFWSCVVLGISIKTELHEGVSDPIKKGLILGLAEILKGKTGTLSKWLRGDKKNRCGHHEKADKCGYEMGALYVDEFIRLQKLTAN